MDSSESNQLRQSRLNPVDKLKNRLFERGVGHSSMSSFRSPLNSSVSNKTLLVTLTSPNSSKFSPKAMKHPVAGLAQTANRFPEGRKMASQAKQRRHAHSGDNIGIKEAQFLQEIAKQERKGTNPKYFTSSNFYSTPAYDQVDQVNQRLDGSKAEYSEQFRRTKFLVHKLAGKTLPEDKKFIMPASPKRQQTEQIRDSGKTESPHNTKEDAQKMTLDNYIARALRNEPDLQQFLYLANYRKSDITSDRQEEDPYQLYIMEYQNNKQIEMKLAQKYYTVSKKGLCFYVNSKPVEFIELDEWVVERQNYLKIKNLNFFSRFRKWKTVKMWRKIVLRHRIEECSKNLDEKLFLMNPTMRSCLFEIRHISLEMGKNIVIISSNEAEYSLENFRAIQEQTKRKVTSIIQQFSFNSRTSVKKCFEESLRNLRSLMKEKQKEQVEQKVPAITNHVNLKDSAFQALGFPSKMSYENRSKLRKLAGKLIRFSYLVDMIHTAGLSSYFEAQLSSFIAKLKQSQAPEHLEVLMTRQDVKTTPNTLEEQLANPKMFNVRLNLNEKEIPEAEVVEVPFPQTAEGSEIFNPLYDIKLYSEPENAKSLRKYCPNICKEWLELSPQLSQIYEEIILQVRQSLSCLKFFERWSKHRQMEKYMNILEQWDDVVSETREIAENENLDPVAIISNIDVSLGDIKSIIERSLGLFNNRVREQLTQFLNIYWEQSKLDMDLFRHHDLRNQAESVELFLKYVTANIEKIEKKIPYRVKLGMFEFNLSAIRVELLRRVEQLSNKFKDVLPEVVEERTIFINNWLSKYNEVVDQEVKNIDDFVSKVKHIRDIEQTFQRKKELCNNLSSIYQIMEAYKFNTKKRKDFESITLKLKDQLQKQIMFFEQNFERQAEAYSREVVRTYLPNIIKDISKLSTLVKSERFISLSKTTNYNDLAKQIDELQKKYLELKERNKRCIEYQEIFNQVNDADKNQETQALKMVAANNSHRHDDMPVHFHDLITIEEYIECLKLLWQKHEYWTKLYSKYSSMTVKSILEIDLGTLLQSERAIIEGRLRRVFGANEVVEQLSKKVEIFEKYIPIISGLNNSLSQSHWEEISELVQKNSNSASINLRKLETLTFPELVSSCIGEFKDEFQQIFVTASNQLKLQTQYNDLEKKWKSVAVRTRIEGKYHVIYDQTEHNNVMEAMNQALTMLSQIFADPFSNRLQIGVLTYEGVLTALETYRKWVIVQRKLVALDRICKSIETKKIAEGNLLENAEKQYKAIFKILLARNVETHFNITKLLPLGNVNISEKLEECSTMLNNLEGNIRLLLNESRKNYPLFYQLSDGELLRVMMETCSQQNSGPLTAVLEELICQKFFRGVIKELKVEGQRLVGVKNIDNDNMLKAPISMNVDLQTILDQVSDAVADYTRRTMRACRNRSLDNSLLDIVNEFNVQFLLAINKVDFSNYTAISIENCTQNRQSLKQYLKILAKDTKNGTQKLLSKKSGNILGCQAIILQNLVNQSVLQGLVNEGITCANEYGWLRYLRFYWEDTGNNLEETNISIRKMHISLRYGKEYVGSRARVLIEGGSTTPGHYDNLDVIMAVIRSSEPACYLGNVDRLACFTDCIAHRLHRMQCHKQMAFDSGNPFWAVLRSRPSSDCFFYIQNCHLLNEEALYELLRHYQKSKQTEIIPKGTSKHNLLNESFPFFYNPVFLHFPRNENTLFSINRQKYRCVGLAPPGPQFLACYLYLISEQIASHAKEDLRVSSPGCAKHGSRSPKAKDPKPDKSYQEVMSVIMRVFQLVTDLQTTDNNQSLCIEAFMADCRAKVSNVLRNTPAGSAELNALIQKAAKVDEQNGVDLQAVVVTVLISYLSTLVQASTFSLVLDLLCSLHPQLELPQPVAAPPGSAVQVTVITGQSDCLKNYQQLDEAYRDGQFVMEYVNMNEFSDEQLYGRHKTEGLLSKLLKAHFNRPQLSTVAPKTVIIINGISESLIKYLSALLGESKIQVRSLSEQPKCRSAALDCSLTIGQGPSHQPAFRRNLSQPEENRAGSLLSTRIPYIFDFEKGTQTNSILEAVLARFFGVSMGSAAMNQQRPTAEPQLEIIVHAPSLNQLIDPKIITEFRVLPALGKFHNHWNYINSRLNAWLDAVDKSSSGQPIQFKVFRQAVSKFYSTTIKGLWKDLYKVVEFTPLNDKTSTQSVSLGLSECIVNDMRDFLNFLQTLVPELLALPVAEAKEQASFHRACLHACMYSLCFIYKAALFNQPDSVKLQNALQRLQAESWAAIPEADRLKPDEYPTENQKNNLGFAVNHKRLTYFDFIFDGHQLVPLHTYSKHRHQERIIERGEFYLTDHIIHQSLVATRVFKSDRLGVLLLGGRNSGKTAFAGIYKSLHHADEAYLTINAYNKNKTNFYSKMCSVLSVRSIDTLGPRLNYARAVVMVDDLSLPAHHDQSHLPFVQDRVKVANFFSTLISHKTLVVPNYNRYRLMNVSFLLSCHAASTSNPSLPVLDDSVIKLRFDSAGLGTEEFGIKRIFTEILKANVLDPEIDEKCLGRLIDVSFGFLEDIAARLSEKPSEQSDVVNFVTIKKMCLFSAHLRFKPNNPSPIQIERFWAFQLKDSLQTSCRVHGIDFNSLQTYNRLVQGTPTPKSLPSFLKQPQSNILYSHLYIKQQVYGNGKEVEHVRDIRKLYNLINEAIEDYNKTDKIKRYGHSFEFISLDELIIKIIRLSNRLVSGDYAIFARPGSEVGGIIRLVSYIQGFNYKQKTKKDSTLVDMVREIIPELTKVSSYLFAMKVDDSNVGQFLAYYDSDFEAEIAMNYFGDLHSIESTGAFDFSLLSAPKSAKESMKEGGAVHTATKTLQRTTTLTGTAINNNLKSGNAFTATPKESSYENISSHNRMRSLSSVAPVETIRFSKPTLGQINKMKRSVRIVYEFNSTKYLRPGSCKDTCIPSYVLSQLHVDFFEEYPRESVIRFSEEILGVNTSNEQAPEVKELIELAKDKLPLICQIYMSVRQELRLSLKQYEECIRLYWSFIGTFPQEIMEKMSKYDSIIDINTKVTEMIAEVTEQIQNSWEEKKNLVSEIGKLKALSQESAHELSQAEIKVKFIEEEIQKMEASLSSLNNHLQELTQRKSQYEKVVSFLSPCLAEVEKKHKTAVEFTADSYSYLKQTLVVIASYFTYLAKLPFSERKKFLGSWYRACPSLAGTSQQRRVTSICDIFCLIREQDMIINEQNEQFYENMTIILESIKPVLIRDDRQIGRNWMKSFDTSFATVSEDQPDFFAKLGEYLGNSNNILLEVADQLTLNNSHSNFINTLIFMSENTPRIEINETEYDVAKESKVYIVVAPHLEVPEEVLADHLFITYEQDEPTLLKNIEHEIQMAHSIERHSQHLEFRKRQLFMRNECVSLEYSLTNMVWHEFYGKEDEESTQSNGDAAVKKSREELINIIGLLAKRGVLDKLQEFMDKYKSKLKLLEEIKDKLSSQPEPNKLAIQKILTCVTQTYDLLLLERSLPSLTRNQYYEKVKQALKQGYLVFNIDSQGIETERPFYNLGMFVLWVLRQWGQGLTREWGVLLALGLAIIVEGAIECNDLAFIQPLREFAVMLGGDADHLKFDPSQAARYCKSSPKCRVLVELAQALTSQPGRYCIQTIEQTVAQSISKMLDPSTQGHQIILHNAMPSIFYQLPKPNKLDANMVAYVSPTSNKGWIDSCWLLKHIIIIKGHVKPEFFRSEQMEEGGADATTRQLWTRRKVLEKLLGPDLSNIAQIRNSENVDQELKKILNEKASVYIPVDNEPVLSSLLNELSTKYRPRAPAAEPRPAVKSILQPSFSSTLSDVGKHSPASSIKVADDFRVFIYGDEANIKKCIARCLNMEAQAVRVFVKDASNPMQCSHLVCKSIKSQLPINTEQPEEQQLDRSACRPQRSRRALQQTVQPRHRNHRPSIRSIEESQQMPESAFRTLKQLAAATSSVQHLKQLALLILDHVLQVVQLKGGDYDYYGNGYNQVYIGDHYFVGIDRINQPIASENEGWHYGKAVAVVCKIVRNLMSNSVNHNVKVHVIKLMDKLIAKMLEFKAVRSPSLSPVKVYKPVGEELKEFFPDEEMDMVDQLVAGMLQQDLALIRSDPDAKDEPHWGKYKQQAQFGYFKLVFVDPLRQLVQLPYLNVAKPCKAVESILNAGFNNVNNSASKRLNRRSKNINSQDLTEFRKKYPLSKSMKPLELPKNQQEVQIQTTPRLDHVLSSQNTLLRPCAMHYFERDIKSMLLKINLTKNHYEYLKSEAEDKASARKHGQQYYVGNILYSLAMINNGSLLPASWRSFVKQILPEDECVHLSSTFKNLVEIKCDLERQLVKLSRDGNFSVDLTTCSSPIGFIKAYLCNQFIGKCKEKGDQKALQASKQEATHHYCISSIAPTEEGSKQKFIRLKNLTAVGWKLNNEGTLELTQEDKLTQLSNVYICRRMKPQQMGLCEVELLESDKKTQEFPLCLSVLTKKNQGGKLKARSAFVKPPRQPSE